MKRCAAVARVRRRISKAKGQCTAGALPYVGTPKSDADEQWEKRKDLIMKCSFCKKERAHTTTVGLREYCPAIETDCISSCIHARETIKRSGVNSYYAMCYLRTELVSAFGRNAPGRLGDALLKVVDEAIDHAERKEKP